MGDAVARVLSPGDLKVSKSYRTPEFGILIRRFGVSCFVAGCQGKAAYDHTFARRTTERSGDFDRVCGAEVTESVSLHGSGETVSYPVCAHHAEVLRDLLERYPQN